MAWLPLPSRGAGGLSFPKGLSAAALSPACLPQPQGMTGQQYTGSCLLLAMLGLLCLCQVYTYRLRRTITAFFFPKMSGQREFLRPVSVTMEIPGFAQHFVLNLTYHQG